MKRKWLAIGPTVVQPPPPQIKKFYVKNTQKFGVENEASNLFCKHHGNRF